MSHTTCLVFECLCYSLGLVISRLGTHDLETHNLETFDLLKRLCIHLEFCAKSQAFLEHCCINLDYYLEF